eukprot:CAMPEP_0175376496 /NCGR_PEP_ID=MMETSP0095-20121207/24305_1 /TAXON_ID=311494 /ORGANISM="Alexandrium monilatum, Strain CCMP3105" /LENGTH=151 /DNA_ID=CAMNT_0016674781 /DNA_START=158 /DNA_END=610 /DNA_ORIENTATION=+
MTPPTMPMVTKVLLSLPPFEITTAGCSASMTLAMSVTQGVRLKSHCSSGIAVVVEADEAELGLHPMSQGIMDCSLRHSCSWPALRVQAAWVMHRSEHLVAMQTQAAVASVLLRYLSQYARRVVWVTLMSQVHWNTQFEYASNFAPPRRQSD